MSRQEWEDLFAFLIVVGVLSGLGYMLMLVIAYLSTFVHGGLVS
jgi:hypothetical protein